MKRRSLPILLLIIIVFIIGCTEEISNEELATELEELSDEELDLVMEEDESAISGDAKRFPPSRGSKFKKIRRNIKKTPLICSESADTITLSRGSYSRTLPKFFCAFQGKQVRERDCRYSGYTSLVKERCEKGCEEGKCIVPCPEGEYFLEYNEDGSASCGQCLQDEHCVEQFGGGYTCVSGSCAPPREEELYDNEERLSDYARSLAPETLALNLNELPKLYPENYGDNYFEPGTYTVHVGDGFGKGDFLIKFVEFNEENGILYEVFKKESNGEYYHFPTDVNKISKYMYNQDFDIVLEKPDYTTHPNENTLIYHSNCNTYFEYCDDESSDYYAYGDPESCNWRCPFIANDNEVKVQESIYSAIYPQGYENLANFAVDLLEQCYNNDIQFLGYDQEKLRLGVKVLLSDSGGPMTGHGEYVSTKRTTEQLNDNVNILNLLISEKENQRCTNYLNLGHELTHSLTKEMLGNNYGLNEGLAEFVAFQNGNEKEYTCLEAGWRDTSETEVHSYIDLSTSPSEERPSGHYYATGYCFWNEFVLEYGYPKFVEVMQQSYQKSRGTNNYYVLDIIEEVIGEPLSEDILNRYSLTRETTIVDNLCNNCDMFIS
jgi:hypothetical protein